MSGPRTQSSSGSFYCLVLQDHWSTLWWLPWLYSTYSSSSEPNHWSKLTKWTTLRWYVCANLQVFSVLLSFPIYPGHFLSQVHLQHLQKLLHRSGRESNDCRVCQENIWSEGSHSLLTNSLTEPTCEHSTLEVVVGTGCSLSNRLVHTTTWREHTQRRRHKKTNCWDKHTYWLQTQLTNDTTQSRSNSLSSEAARQQTQLHCFRLNSANSELCLCICC